MDETHGRQVVKDIFVDELVLADALNHAVALLSQPPDDTEDRDARFRLLTAWSLSFVLRECAQGLQDVEDGDDRAGSADASAAMKHDLAR